MKKLDDRVRVVMGDSITEGAPVEIAARGTKLQLARWAMKVALLLSLWIHDEAADHPELVASTERLDPRRPSLGPYVPKDDFEHLYRRQRPPEHALIWFGAKASNVPDFFVSSSALSTRTTTGLQRIGYYVLFALRNLVVYVLAGAPSRDGVLRQMLGNSSPAEFVPDRLSLVWPVADPPVRWPPRKSIDEESIGALTGATVAWDPQRPNQTRIWNPVADVPPG